MEVLEEERPVLASSMSLVGMRHGHSIARAVERLLRWCVSIILAVSERVTSVLGFLDIVVRHVDAINLKGKKKASVKKILMVRVLTEDSDI